MTSFRRARIDDIDHIAELLYSSPRAAFSRDGARSRARVMFADDDSELVVGFSGFQIPGFAYVSLARDNRYLDLRQLRLSSGRLPGKLRPLQFLRPLLQTAQDLWKDKLSGASLVRRSSGLQGIMFTPRGLRNGDEALLERLGYRAIGHGYVKHF